MDRAETLENGMPNKECGQCKTWKPLTEFTAVDIKFGYWANAAKRGKTWRCCSCAYPTCTFVENSGKVPGHEFESNIGKDGLFH